MSALKNNYAMAADKRWVNTMGALDGARRELKNLAPHPEQKDKTATVSASDNQRAAASNSRDGALGSMVLEGILGMSFGAAIGDALNLSPGAAEWVGDVEWGNLVEVYDEYRNDRRAQNNTTETSTYKLGERGLMSFGFNKQTTPATPKKALEWDAYMRDLPQRRALEQTMHGLNAALDQMEARQFRKLELAPA